MRSQGRKHEDTVAGREGRYLAGAQPLKLGERGRRSEQKGEESERHRRAAREPCALLGPLAQAARRQEHNQLLEQIDRQRSLRVQRDVPQAARLDALERDERAQHLRHLLLGDEAAAQPRYEGEAQKDRDRHDAKHLPDAPP